MSARARFMLAVVVLFLLMTGPFLLTALIVWFETEGEARDLLLRVLVAAPRLGTMLTAMGFAAGVGVVRVLFRQYVQGLLRMSENLRLMLGANRGFRVQPEGPPEVQMPGARHQRARQPARRAAAATWRRRSRAPRTRWSSRRIASPR
jgi:DNA polymerase-3 subunit epsilon